VPHHLSPIRLMDTTGRLIAIGRCAEAPSVLHPSIVLV